jgi:Alpha-L-fucosidase
VLAASRSLESEYRIMKKMTELSSSFLGRIALAAALAILFCSAKSSAQETATNDASLKMWQEMYGPSHEERMQWWRDARFGMFIHWGVYSVPAGVYKGQPVDHAAEWIMRTTNIPVAEYAQFTKQFDPTNFNAEEWVKIAKNAGMKYIVIIRAWMATTFMMRRRGITIRLQNWLWRAEKKISGWDFIIPKRRTGIIRAAQRRTSILRMTWMPSIIGMRRKKAAWMITLIMLRCHR